MRNKNRSVEIGFKRELKSGYVEVKTEFGWIREHVFVMEKAIGRKLTKEEVVHHIDGVKNNNCITNLELMTNGEHSAFHNKNTPVSEETKKKIAIKSCRYSMSQANDLRQLIRSGYSQRQAAKSIGISQMAASRMARGLTYKDSL